jgi:hypothetical protein
MGNIETTPEEVVRAKYRRLVQQASEKPIKKYRPKAF